MPSVRFFVPSDSQEQIPIPKDFEKLSNFIKDYPLDDAVIPLSDFGAAEIKLLLSVTDYIRTNLTRIYKQSLEGGDFVDSVFALTEPLPITAENATFIKATNLADYLGIAVTRAVLLNHIANNIVFLEDNVDAICQLTGSQVIDQNVCAAYGLQKDDRLWNVFPSVQSMIFKDSQ